MAKRICFVTGTRADFGKLKPLIERIDQSPTFECFIFATGMHALRRYGNTVNEIKKAGFANIFLHINQFADGGSAMDTVLANTVQGFAHYLREYPADLIVIHGDRIEAIACALVGALNNVLVAHIEGGERSGTIDDSIRHAVSKMAHLHFVANEEAKQRLLQLGEREASIHVIGSPDIDVMLSEHLPSLEQAKNRYEIPFSEYFIFMYHPVTTELEQLPANLEAVLSAVVASQQKFIVIYPNNDAGSEIIFTELDHLKDNPNLKLYSSLRFEYFLVLLKHAKAIVGNSSAGIREAPVYGVPTLNIGTRQSARATTESITNVPEDKDQILGYLTKHPPHRPGSFHFGDGNSADLFAKALNKDTFWQTPKQKTFQDLPLEAFPN
ncbi:UDP-N-acetylglucosamine 2-epimerase [Acanthopleuribacter pedis]|uniref:UDP-N-acetylglucosamine 2-epimerase (Hydrolyzing) n=1 Tax=Acanthopleuribacter pedis TaxID=442870 RepID=A0A8J7Q4N3_9BACT|nr:UDP-N-acetylglucosamine 2-epimerase [Acanthopleuribacter pedis]MBO1318012.1 UDP-N-acetylglucosamine 2-epimerase (hydrolyzing) [Acanthopleuribacter pedis]